MTNTDDLEAKLLEILSQSDLATTMSDAVEAVVEDDKDRLTQDQVEALRVLLDSGLPPPEEILAAAQRAEANDDLDVKRAKDLARRKARREKLGKRKRRRR